MIDVLKQTDNEIRVYQNNASNLLIINTQHTGNLSATLYSISGLILYKGALSNKQASISTAGFASGIYILKVSGNGTTKTQKIVIGK
jgi:hypothetical protein